eukprot:1141647-Pelagomonas_calceolata.AAC.1
MLPTSANNTCCTTGVVNRGCCGNKRCFPAAVQVATVVEAVQQRLRAASCNDKRHGWRTTRGRQLSFGATSSGHCSALLAGISFVFYLKTCATTLAPYITDGMK